MHLCFVGHRDASRTLKKDEWKKQERLLMSHYKSLQIEFVKFSPLSQSRIVEYDA